MHRRKGRGRLLLLVFIALSILIITVDFRGTSGPLESVKDFSQAVISPVQRGLSTVTRPIGNFFSSIGELADLRNENDELSAEVESLRAEVDQARDLTAENVELREHLELDEPWFAQDRVAAQVIADAPGNFRWAVIIDKGKADGIRTDMAVVNPDGLVGKIVHVDSHQATVLLLIDPKGGAAAAVGDGEVTGLVSGNGGGEDLSLEFVAKEEELEEGDRVVTSSFNQGIYPPGIPIGLISSIGGDVRAAELEVGVNPFVDFGDLNIMSVLLETGASAVRLGEAE
jgi:rod shape-determining protein MreC